MKKTIFTLLLAATMPMAIYAQDKTADDYKNEGNAAVREKNFKDGLDAYEKALELWGDSLDHATVYNAGTCAKNINDHDKAIKYFKMSIELKYKDDFATYYLAEEYGKIGDNATRLATLEEGFEKYKTGKPASFIQKSLVKEYRDKAMDYYNEGNKILGECQTAKPEQYAEIQGRAKEKFKEAKPWIEKALAVNPEDETCKQIENNINEQIK